MLMPDGAHSSYQMTMGQLMLFSTPPEFYRMPPMEKP